MKRLVWLIVVLVTAPCKGMLEPLALDVVVSLSDEEAYQLEQHRLEVEIARREAAEEAQNLSINRDKIIEVLDEDSECIKN